MFVPIFLEKLFLYLLARQFLETQVRIYWKSAEDFLFEVSESVQESRPMRFSRAVNLGSDRRLSNVGSTLSKTRMKS